MRFLADGRSVTNRTRGNAVNAARMTAVGLLVGILFSALSTAVARGQAATKSSPRTPFAFLFDTGRPASEPLTAAVLAGRDGWRQVPEDQLTHRFTGDVVCLNDRIVLVVRRHGQGAELYSRNPKTLA